MTSYTSSPELNSFTFRFWFGQTGTKALALFRIAFSLLLVRDIIYRITLVDLFFTEDGLSPISALAGQYLVSSTIQSVIFANTTSALVFHFLWLTTAISLLFGYRTRTAIFLNFIFIASAQLRNILILNGADTVMRTCSFWILFLPLGARWSLDSRRNGGSQDSTYAFPLRLIQFQIAIVYAVTALFKQNQSIWLSGEALHSSLQVVAFINPVGEWMVQFLPTTLFPLLNYGVLVVEHAFLPLVFLPLAQPRARIIGLVLCASMHIGILICMSIPNFSIVMLITYILFLEDEWIDNIFKFLKLPIKNVATKASNNLAIKNSLLPKAILTGFLCFCVFGIIISNISALNSKNFSPTVHSYPGILNLVSYLGLEQRWPMFANPSQINGWITVVATRNDGTEQTLWPEGAKIDAHSQQYFGPALRTRRFFNNLSSSAKRLAIHRAITKYYCSNTVGTNSISIWYTYRISHRIRESKNPLHKDTLWNETCKEALQKSA